MSLQSIPDHVILEHIIPRLGFYDLNNFGATCKSYFTLTQVDDNYKRIENSLPRIHRKDFPLRFAPKQNVALYYLLEKLSEECGKDLPPMCCSDIYRALYSQDDSIHDYCRNCIYGVPSKDICTCNRDDRWALYPSIYHGHKKCHACIWQLCRNCILPYWRHDDMFTMVKVRDVGDIDLDSIRGYYEDKKAKVIRKHMGVLRKHGYDVSPLKRVLGEKKKELCQTGFSLRY